jgi:hypothetical protein
MQPFIVESRKLFVLNKLRGSAFEHPRQIVLYKGFTVLHTQGVDQSCTSIKPQILKCHVCPSELKWQRNSSFNRTSL